MLGSRGSKCYHQESVAQTFSVSSGRLLGLPFCVKKPVSNLFGDELGPPPCSSNLWGFLVTGSRLSELLTSFSSAPSRSLGRFVLPPSRHRKSGEQKPAAGRRSALEIDRTDGTPKNSPKKAEAKGLQEICLQKMANEKSSYLLISLKSRFCVTTKNQTTPLTRNSSLPSAQSSCNCPRSS